MANFLDAIGVNPISETKKKDSIGTKLLKNTANAAINRGALAPVLGVSPLAAVTVAAEGAIATAEQVISDKSIWNKNWVTKAVGKDLGVLKTNIHSKTQITPGPGQMTQDQKDLQNLMKIATQQQQQLNEVGKNLGNVMNDLYGDGPADPGNNYGTEGE